VCPRTASRVSLYAVRPVPRAEAARRLSRMTLKNRVANCNRRDAVALAMEAARLRRRNPHYLQREVRRRGALRFCSAFLAGCFRRRALLFRHALLWFHLEHVVLELTYHHKQRAPVQPELFRHRPTKSKIYNTA
jgi:hypothetical protein